MFRAQTGESLQEKFVVGQVYAERMEKEGTSTRSDFLLSQCVPNIIFFLFPYVFKIPPHDSEMNVDVGRSETCQSRTSFHLAHITGLNWGVKNSLILYCRRWRVEIGNFSIWRFHGWRLVAFVSNLFTRLTKCVVYMSFSYIFISIFILATSVS